MDKHLRAICINVHKVQQSLLLYLTQWSRMRIEWENMWVKVAHELPWLLLPCKLFLAMGSRILIFHMNKGKFFKNQYLFKAESIDKIVKNHIVITCKLLFIFHVILILKLIHVFLHYTFESLCSSGITASRKFY